jgi:6-phosphogluconolactonase/glucosamine-6-phosphate isomerase/deaminase
MGQIGLKDQFEAGVRATRRAMGGKPTVDSSILVQEGAGNHVGISADLPEAAQHAARVLHEQYREWLERGRFSAWGQYKRQHFVIAVGGGNTLKAQYSAMLDHLYDEIDWLEHVRFFFLEDSSGEKNWESPEDSLIDNFVRPLATKLIKSLGRRSLSKDLNLSANAEEEAIVGCMIQSMVNPIDMSHVREALRAKNRPLALKRAHAEAQRYQQKIQDKLGATMVFHYILSGIGKKGSVGAFAPYMSELRNKEPGAIVLKQGTRALRVALNRGVLINGECISLIVSGNLKLRALGRFEMEETADFEQTVMETPLRMLRETPEIAEKVYMFADEQALHFDETVFKSTENGTTLLNKAETREGEEVDGPHILLLHGFMGLFSFTSFLIRLPSAWTVSALHRGSHAKTLSEDEIFPHYARVLRAAILRQSAKGRPVPVAGHSIAGLILDHLLLSVLDKEDSPITPYDELKGRNRKLIDALRASGIIHLATWAPIDGLHTGKNIKNVVSHYRQKTELNYSGFDQIYQEKNGVLTTTEDATVSDENSLARLGNFLNTRTAEPVVNSINVLMRNLLNNKTIQQKLLNTRSPYVLRLVGTRLLKTASFYGLCKEISGAMHDPIKYQKRHLKALDMVLAYDIPYLCITHEDDFLVSAKRHQEEHAYLLAQRKKKEGVTKEAELHTPALYVKLVRSQEELPLDPLNPHLMILATSSEGSDMARRITSAMTRFVNENIARAVKRGELKSLPSVKKWQRGHSPKKKRSKTKLA